MHLNKKEFLEEVHSAINYLINSGIKNADIAFILGSGQNNLVDKLIDPIIIPFHEIPGMPATTVHFHKGNLIYGKIGSADVIVFQGRFHFYEGYSMAAITKNVRIAHGLGIEYLILTNASGGLNPAFGTGDLVIITDHINFMGDSPLTGLNDVALGTLFPDMNFAYDQLLQQTFLEVATKINLQLQQGIYAAVKGPQLETPAEQRMLRLYGADLVGMSTVPEVITAAQLGIKTGAISIVTNSCKPDGPEVTTVEDVIRVSGQSDHLLAELLVQVTHNLFD